MHGGAHLYMGTLDAHLVALDAKDGKVLWDKEVADPAFGYSITHAPLIIGDNVIVGVSGGEYGIRGHVTAYNAMTGDQVWRWYSIPAPKGDSTFDDKAPNGWFGTWPTSTPDGADLHRDVTKEKGDSAKYADAWKTGGGGVWTTPVVRQGVEHHLPDRRQPVAGPGRQHPPRRQPLHRLHRGHRRDLGQDQVVLPDGAARRLGPRRDLADGRDDAGRQEGRGACRQDRLGLRARRRHRQAGPQERRLRAAGEHVRPADREGHPDAAGRQRRRRSGRRSRSIRASATPSSRRCTSR